VDGWNSPNSNLRISAVYEYLNTSIAPVYRYDTALPACTMLLAMCTNGPQFGTRETKTKPMNASSNTGMPLASFDLSPTKSVTSRRVRRARKRKESPLQQAPYSIWVGDDFFKTREPA